MEGTKTSRIQVLGRALGAPDAPPASRKTEIIDNFYLGKATVGQKHVPVEELIEWSSVLVYYEARFISDILVMILSGTLAHFTATTKIIN